MIPNIVFWAALAFILYAYFGYPALLHVAARVRNRTVRKGDILPKVSVIIAACNEGARIRDKILDTLTQDYPDDRLEILVASDHSTDDTDAVVERFAFEGVRLVRSVLPKGKEYAQKCAVDAAGGEILVFSDTATRLARDGIRQIVRNFHDPEVGCVSSVDRLLDEDGKVRGESAYVRYEMLLRKLESRAGTVVGLSGSFFAARKEVCRLWDPKLQSDFNTVLSSVRLGLRGVSDPESVGYYRNIRDGRKEYQRKVRTVLRGITVLLSSLQLLDPFRYGFFAWQLLSHKLCRWLVPFGMGAMLAANLALAPGSDFYGWMLAGQAAFYLAAVAGMLAGDRITVAILRIPSFFVIVNLSILSAWYRYLKGERITAWAPSVR